MYGSTSFKSSKSCRCVSIQFILTWKSLGCPVSELWAHNQMDFFVKLKALRSQTLPTIEVEVGPT